MLDERYTHDPTESNFAQLTTLPMWDAACKAGVRHIDTRPLPIESLEDTAHRLNIAFKHWHITHHDAVVVATVGIGPDGHIAGILPYPSDPTLFASLFLSDHRCIRGYQVSVEKNPHTKRITTTLAYLKRHVARAVVYATGEEKRTALMALHGSAPIEQVPARILTALPDVQLYTDLSLQVIS
jgi:6-phosphogluconolactonase/glucosamine-6-phosphate isomerase/deaminase